MPQRFLRPGITTSVRFNALDWQAQSFYVRLLTLVDDFGRYDANLMILRSHVFPLGDQTGKTITLQTIENICKQLFSLGLIDFYQTPDGKEILQVLRWKEKPRAAHSRYLEKLEVCKQMLPSLVPRSSPSPVHPRSSSIAPTQPLGWSEQEGWKGTEDLREPFQKAYPACNFDCQLAQAELWLKANPAKAKKSNWQRFLSNWFQRRQDKGGDIPSSFPNGKNGQRQMSAWEIKQKIEAIKTKRSQLWRENRDAANDVPQEIQEELNQLKERQFALEEQLTE